MKLTRGQIIQQLIDSKAFRTYLEIGVFKGKNFLPIRAERKIGVDPAFRIKLSRRLGWLFRNATNLKAEYFEQTSDSFFQNVAPGLIQKSSLDVCLVDGMHEYEYALRDVEHALEYLQQDGVIIMHDCNPASAQAGCTFEQWKAGNFAWDWNGDVWKAILHLRSLRNDIDVFVLDTDMGLGVVAKRPPQQQLNFTKEQIQALTYDDLAANRASWLNLKPAPYIFSYFGI
ncbi:class I SAM-dependent methyltransferase [Chitinophaga cymbidii]